MKRLRAGEEVVLTDGAGRWAAGEVDGTEGKDRLIVRLGEVVEEPAQTPRLTVVQALPKGDRGELAVETMTEVGVDAIVPWSASRCITQWKGERGAKSLAKWRATAREAGKQSRRVRFPDVADAATTKGVASLLAEAEFAAVLHESATEPLAERRTPRLRRRIVLVVGPEGGISPDELERLFAQAGAQPYRLGRSVLRAPPPPGNRRRPSSCPAPAAGPDVPGLRPGPRALKRRRGSLLSQSRRLQDEGRQGRQGGSGAQPPGHGRHAWPYCALPSRERRWHAAVHGGVEQDSARDARPAAAGARRRVRRGRRRRCGRL
ncbi:hypothetical protein SALBM217S_07848 [Streptomyces griseoloalbus]